MAVLAALSIKRVDDGWAMDYSLWFSDVYVYTATGRSITQLLVAATKPCIRDRMPTVPS